MGKALAYARTILPIEKKIVSVCLQKIWGHHESYLIKTLVHGNSNKRIQSKRGMTAENSEYGKTYCVQEKQSSRRPNCIRTTTTP